MCHMDTPGGPYILTFEMQDGRTLRTPTLTDGPDGVPRVVHFPANYKGESYEALMWAGVTGHAPHVPSVRQRGMVPWCECGWHPNLEEGALLAEHLQEESDHTPPKVI